MANEPLHFDFTQSALRKDMFGPMVELLENRQKFMIAQAMNDYCIKRDEHLHDIKAVEQAIDRSSGTEFMKENARCIYRILAQAESQVHGCPVEETHFHEVGRGKTLLEILSICKCIELIEPSKITASAVQVGSGTVECEHGTLSIPAPATAAILETYHIPICETKLEGELCSPTSAALIAHFVKEFA